MIFYYLETFINSKNTLMQKRSVDLAPPRGELIANDDMSQCIIFLE